MSLFAFPVVGRAGLGNMLLPWARAEVFARRHRVRVIKPAWNTIRLGPYLRREPQKRDYIGFFNGLDHVRGMAKLVCLSRADRISETQYAISTPDRLDGGKPCVVCFEGLSDYFAPLLDEHEFVRQRLWQMTRARLQVGANPYGDRFIAMHIRRGDITRQGFSPEQLMEVAQYTPIGWFAGMAQAVRRRGELAPLPIVLFTDGTGDEVSNVLRQHGVRLHRPGAAIADLWTLARASLLFASGYSTFSMWASYLGGMPTVYAPGKIQQRLQGGRPEPIEIELAADAELPCALLGRVAAAGRA